MMLEPSQKPPRPLKIFRITLNQASIMGPISQAHTIP
jgi:hypothetical protein